MTYDVGADVLRLEGEVAGLSLEGCIEAVPEEVGIGGGDGVDDFAVGDILRLDLIGHGEEPDLTGLEAETATLAGGGDTNGLQIVLSANVTESAIPLSGDEESGAVKQLLDAVPNA